jgi:hypothetical protein
LHPVEDLPCFVGLDNQVAIQGQMLFRVDKRALNAHIVAFRPEAVQQTFLYVRAFFFVSEKPHSRNIDHNPTIRIEHLAHAAQQVRSLFRREDTKVGINERCYVEAGRQVI